TIEVEAPNSTLSPSAPAKIEALGLVLPTAPSEVVLVATFVEFEQILSPNDLAEVEAPAPILSKDPTSIAISLPESHSDLVHTLPEGEANIVGPELPEEITDLAVDT
ncbi:unnamed protein product, partial [Ilex paraguariensis]